MEENKLQQLPERRDLIHDLILLKNKTGLSPPEELILVQEESEEVYDDNVTDCY